MGVAVCESRGVGELQCRGVVVCDSCNIGDCHCWGNAFCGDYFGYKT